jgi:hypothetical protein
VTYWGVAGAEFSVFDDPGYVFDHPRVGAGLSWSNVRWALTHQHEAMWHPLTTLSHMLDVQLFGLNPGPHHIENVLLHAISSVLLFFAMTRLTGSVNRSGCVAAVFALHPLHVESVAWISERKDVLSGLFFMLTLLAYASYVRRPGLRRYLLVAFALTAGLLCKPMLVTTPFVLLLIDYWPLDRGCEVRWTRLVAEKLPLLLICLAVGIITFMTQEGARHVGQLPLWPRVSNAIVSYMRYVGKAFWPSDLSIFYPHPGLWPTPLIVASALALVLFTLIVVAVRQRWRYLVVGWLWFVGMLGPVIGIVQVGGQAMADRYCYLPLIGLSILFIWFVSDAAQSIGGGRYLLILVLVLVGACVAQSSAQVGYWTMNELLFTHALEVTGENAMLRGQLATALRMHGKLDEALEQRRIIVRNEPGNSEAHRELAISLSELHRPAEARQEFMQALAIDPRNAKVYVDLARYFLSEGNRAAADNSIHEAEKIDPASAYLHRFQDEQSVKSQ